jgi:hypothetical protein
MFTDQPTKRRRLIRATIEKLHLGDANWRSILLQSPWDEKIILLEAKSKIDKILTLYQTLID